MYDSQRRTTETRTEVTEESGTKVYLSQNVYTADRLTETSHNTVEDTIPGAGAVDTTVRYYFGYDAEGRPAMVEYGGAKYAYIHSLQGDVLGLTDSSGTEVVRYNYDAWGTILSVTGTMANTLGKIQPFRYRGYVYDEETGLYYLRSRYYNSNWERFINKDNAIIDVNLFNYCTNNPVVKIDASGYEGTYYVIDYNVYFRKNKSKNSDYHYKFSCYSTVVVIDSSNPTWWKVRAGSKEGYVQKEYLSSTKPIDYDIVQAANIRYGYYDYPSERNVSTFISNLQIDLNYFFTTYEKNNPDDLPNDLTNWACYPLTVDGVFGTVTKTAVTEVQQRLGIYPADGIADQEFKVELYRYLLSVENQ